MKFLFCILNISLDVLSSPVHWTPAYINYIIVQAKICYPNLIILSKSYNVNLCKLGTCPIEYYLFLLNILRLSENKLCLLFIITITQLGRNLFSSSSFRFRCRHSLAFAWRLSISLPCSVPSAPLTLSEPFLEQFRILILNPNNWIRNFSFFQNKF